MKEPYRLRQLEAELKSELNLALLPDAVEPNPLELQLLASKLGGALGIALAPPVATAVASATGTAQSAALAGAVKTLSAWQLGAWVLGGVALGVGLSGAVTATIAASDSPAPNRSAAPQAATKSGLSRPVAEAPLSVVPQPPLPVDQRAAATPTSSTSHKPPRVGSAGLVSELPLPSEDELSVLRRAQESLAANPAQALALSGRHEREFTDGALAQEREVIAIDALLRLGRDAEAAARARRFEAAHPGSAHARRVQQLLNDARKQ
jgi:hypothetical protein